MFAADVSNYFKDSMAKNFLKGGAITTTQNIINCLYVLLPLEFTN